MTASALSCRRAFLPPRFPAAALSCRRAFLPPRFPAAALTIASFALAALAIFCSPAQASYWNVAITDKGGSNATFKGYSNPWTPPANGNNTNSFDLYAADTIDGSDDTQDDNSSVTVNATITLTWVASPAGDPAPTSIDIVESGYADAFAAGMGATVSASDGISGDTYDPDDPETDEAGGTMETPDDLPAGGRLTVKPVSGGTLTFNRTLTASGSSSYSSTDSFPGTQNAEVSYTVSIHAQPYGWYDVGWSEPNGTHHAGPVINNTNGTLTFEYGWKSTDGNLADLKGISMYEYLSYSGPGTFSSDNTTFYPGPPATSGYSVSNGKAGSVIDPTHLYAVDNQSPFPTTSSLTAATWTAAQKYEFDDPATNEVGTVLYDAGNITDAVQLNPNQFYVSKSGYSATKPL